MLCRKDKIGLGFEFLFLCLHTFVQTAECSPLLTLSPCDLSSGVCWTENIALPWAVIVLS